MTGTVVTFYSYKGGVGRSFALVNVAALLGQWGFRVLCIDWDLEAPGLDDFFKPYLQESDSQNSGGIVELLTGFAKTRQVPLEWRNCLKTLREDELPKVEFVSAGVFDPDYMRRLQKLNWARLYKQGLGEALETMFDELRSEYDFILVDSRTGVTDFSGIVTAQLPDVLAFLFTANEQSLGGATSVARRAVTIRNDLAIDRSRLLLLPIPARFESQVEYDISSRWRGRFAETLKEFYVGWANRDVPIEKLVQATTIPYVPFWSFGERISAVEDRTSDTSSINYSMENIAALLAQKLGQTKLLVESRDEYVGAARRLGRSPENSIFLSYSAEQLDTARKIALSLRRRGFTINTSDQVNTGQPISDALRRIMTHSTHFVLLFDRSLQNSKFIYDDVRSFVRQSASDEADRQLVPILMPDIKTGELPSFLRQYRSVKFTSPESAAEEVWRRIGPVASAQKNDSHVSVAITSEGGLPIADAQICALAENGTIVAASSDFKGQATLELVPGKSYQILAAHPSFAPKITANFSSDSVLKIRLTRTRGVGSIIIQSTGYIPDLNGRLNPVHDTSDRTYLYATNIAINGGKRQPVNVVVQEPFLLEDNTGKIFRVIVRLIQGRTTLLEYEKASSQVTALFSLTLQIERALHTATKSDSSGDVRKIKNTRNRQWHELADHEDLRNPDDDVLHRMLGEYFQRFTKVLKGENLSPNTLKNTTFLADEIIQILNSY
jgi:hypothetical protein